MTNSSNFTRRRLAGVDTRTGGGSAAVWQETAEVMRTSGTSVWENDEEVGTSTWHEVVWVDGVLSVELLWFVLVVSGRTADNVWVEEVVDVVDGEGISGERMRGIGRSGDEGVEET